MELFMEMTNRWTHASTADLSFEIGSIVLFNGVDIYRELSAAYTNFWAKEYENFGRGMGAAFAKVFLGREAIKRLSDQELRAVTGMIEAQVYPTLSKGLYSREDDLKYVETLDFIAKARAGSA